MSTKASTPKQVQFDRTRKALLRVARRLFARHGYAATGTDEVVRQAGVTRGALYYHFKDKEALFAAVFEEVERQIARKIQRAAVSRRDVWEGLSAGCHAFLDACCEPSIRRIALLDAPSVLGWAKWREVDAQYALGLLAEGLHAAIDVGEIDQQPLEPLTHLISGALNEAAFVISDANDMETTRREVGQSFDRLLAGLRSRTKSGTGSEPARESRD